VTAREEGEGVYKRPHVDEDAQGGESRPNPSKKEHDLSVSGGRSLRPKTAQKKPGMEKESNGTQAKKKARSGDGHYTSQKLHNGEEDSPFKTREKKKRTVGVKNATSSAKLTKAPPQRQTKVTQEIERHGAGEARLKK